MIGVGDLVQQGVEDLRREINEGEHQKPWECAGRLARSRW
jgi:hypothetical protein